MSAELLHHLEKAIQVSKTEETRYAAARDVAQRLRSRLDRAEGEILALKTEIEEWRLRCEQLDRLRTVDDERFRCLEQERNGEQSKHDSSITTRLAPTQRLPAEILDNIFSYAILSPELYGDSLSGVAHAPRCATIRTNKSLALVCKSWNCIATEYLYRNIALRRVGHIYALLRALRGSSSLGPMIRTLRVSCLLAQGTPSPELSARCLDDIISICPRLSGVTFPYPSDISSFIIVPMLHKTPCLTRLGLALVVDSALFETFLTQCTTLQHLQFTPYDFNDRPLVLPSIRTLVLEISQSASNIPTAWRLPAMTHFCLNASYYLYIPPAWDDQKLLAFLRVNGDLLETLQIIGGGYLPAASERLSALLTTCPRVEHLVITVAPKSCPALRITEHSALRWIDVWLMRGRNEEFFFNDWPNDQPSKAWEDQWLEGLREHAAELPEWNGRVRWLDMSLFMVEMLPVLLHPGSYNEAAPEVLHTFPGCRIRETERMLWRDEPALPDDPDLPEGEDTTSDTYFCVYGDTGGYSSTESDAESSTQSDAESDNVDDAENDPSDSERAHNNGSDTESSDESSEEELDYETALSRFEATLDLQ